MFFDHQGDMLHVFISPSVPSVSSMSVFVCTNSRAREQDDTSEGGIIKLDCHFTEAGDVVS